MDNENELNDSLKVRFPFRAIVITIVWILSCLLISFIWWKSSYNNLSSSISLSDIGAFLSGICSFLAFYWFIEAYILQSKELRLQRFDLKESIKSQKGSEKALNEQSHALQKQLEITTEQFAIYLRQEEAKKPNFILHSFRKMIVDYKNLTSFESITIDVLNDYFVDENSCIEDYKLEKISIEFIIKNIGGPCELLMKRNFKTNIPSCASITMNSNYRSAKDVSRKLTNDFVFTLDIYFRLDYPRSIHEVSNFEFFITTLIESISFELVTRNQERSYIQEYKMTKKGSKEEILENYNHKIDHKVEDIPLGLLVSEGYQLEKYSDL